MGAGQSLPSTMTHERLFELTKDTRNIMSILLEYMLKEVSVRDFLSLSNPTECKKYVLFMANNLYKYFYELKIYPTKTKQGVLVFRKAQDLASPSDSSTEQEKQGLCLVLAFYYTRIFQIYGALALTLIDDIQMASATGMIKLLSDQQPAQQRLAAPGQRHYYAISGASLLSLGYFSFLKKYLTSSTVDQDYILTKYSETGNKQAKIYFKKTSGGGTDTQKGTFKIVIGDKLPAYIDIYAIKEGTQVKMEMQSIRYSLKTGSSKTMDIPEDVLSSKIVTIQSSIADDTFQIANTGQSIPDFFDAFFQEIVALLRNLSGDAATVAETGIAEELRMTRTIHNLTKVKPLGHCIARALQLLQSQPFEDKTALSYICRAKFLEKTGTDLEGKKTTVTRSGIPEPGSSLDNSPGMAALSQLFYEIIYEATPKIGMSERKEADGRSSLDEYRTFMKNMAILFGDFKDPTDPTQSRSIEDLGRQGLKGIKNRKDKELCKKIGVDDTLSLPNQTAKQINQYVKQLFQIQLQHAAKCGAIFKKLFSIQRDKTSKQFKISLSNNIITNGFPEIQRINTEARRLLVDYYSRCELTYREGMQRIVDYKLSTVAPAPAPVTAAPAPVTARAPVARPLVPPAVAPAPAPAVAPAPAARPLVPPVVAPAPAPAPARAPAVAPAPAARAPARAPVAAVAAATTAPRAAPGAVPRRVPNPT